MRDGKTLFKQEEDKQTSKSWLFLVKNYIEYESNGDRNKNPATNKYLKEIRLFLKNIIIDLQKSNT